ncbi:uncharacterized protein LOC127800188 [Diospyros lotus]|uniref:uncharacterized protein LOC127800188 n=1 Tax=Diospyros lotus TaxID=55363 RepID=UPI002257267D|nr:uncharacterized protein LOC127800188 [Diospyros lotus]
MDLHKRKQKLPAPMTSGGSSSKSTQNFNEAQAKERTNCSNPCCFFCLIKQPKSSVRRAGLASCFREMPFLDNQEHVLVLSGLWNIAMNKPDDPEFPSLGIFHCMASLINRGLSDSEWLLRDQNIYIPYYAVHIIGSYTMNKAEFAERAVESGVIPPLMELARGKMSWVEQRVAVRALGHLASYESTFEAVAGYEEEIVNLAMNLASSCLETVYFMFLKDKKKRLKYHCDLLTRGVGGLEMENRKAEEWASQLQCWSLYLLNSFAIKEKSIDPMCEEDFLKELSGMWGGLMNHSSPAGIGLIRILCYSEKGRKKIAASKEVLETLCNLSRSSDDWQYMGIDCLLFLLNDPDSRYKVIQTAIFSLVDLIELKKIGGRSNFGEVITRTLLLEFRQRKSKIENNTVKRALEEIWDLKVERRKREEMLSDEKVEEKRVLVSLIKQQGNHSFWLGEVEEALSKYTEALELCPLMLRKERIVLYSNRAQCHLLVSDPDAAISDATRALCLSSPVNSHGKSLWRRSQAYDMKGLAKESLMDCIMFINGFIKSNTTKKVKIPYYAVRMINKQMDSTWLFAAARLKASNNHVGESEQSDGGDDSGKNKNSYYEIMRIITDHNTGGFNSGLSTIIEEPLIKKGGSGRRKLETTREIRKTSSLSISP